MHKQILFASIGLILLLATGESVAGGIKGQIVSDRIKNFEDYVVYIKHADPKSFKVPTEPIRSVQKGMKFIPKVLPIVRKSKVVFDNQEENDLHNLHTVIKAPIYFNFGIPPGKEYGPIRFPRSGEVMILCDVHPQITGYILVLQNPYFSTVSKEGYFAIPDVPTGEYELLTWSSDYVSRSQKVTIEKSQTLDGVRFIY